VGSGYRSRVIDHQPTLRPSFRPRPPWRIIAIVEGIGKPHDMTASRSSVAIAFFVRPRTEPTTIGRNDGRCADLRRQAGSHIGAAPPWPLPRAPKDEAT
jgi:hypothetical protein